MKSCENCPASWEDRGYEGECYDCGCLVYDNDSDGCYLNRVQVEKRLMEREKYLKGEIDRPEWIINKWVREMDHKVFSAPAYPPKRMTNGCHESIYTGDQLRWDTEMSYNNGYRDAKDGKPNKYERSENERFRISIM